MYTYLHQASVPEKHSRSIIVTMRVRCQAKHYAIHFRCGYGDGKTAFWVFPNLLHDPRTYVAVEIAFPMHLLVSTASSRQGNNRSPQTGLKSITSLLLPKPRLLPAKRKTSLQIVPTAGHSSQRLDARKMPWYRSLEVLLGKDPLGLKS